MRISKRGNIDPKFCGVYRIYNTEQGKSYIGSSIDIRDRITTHFRLLKDRKHSTKFQNSYNKYSPISWVVEILELCSRDDLLIREQHYIDSYNSFKKGLNSSEKATNNQGHRFTVEQKKRLSEIQKNRWPESRRIKHAFNLKGRKLSEDTKSRMSESQLARNHTISSEHMSKILKVIKGKPLKEEHRKKISEANTGKTLSEERKKLISDKNKEAWKRRKSRKEST